MSAVERLPLGDADVPLVRVPAGTEVPELARLLADAGLAGPRPVVVLVGGADGLDGAFEARCTDVVAGALVPVLERHRALLVDGGTRSGVMALAGDARDRALASGAHVGVVATGTVRWPGGETGGGRAELEPHHTHVVAVPGTEWGDEAPWLSRVATALAGGAPSVTLLLNGGPIAYDDVGHSLSAGRPVVVVDGTGRTADEIAASRAGRPTSAAAVGVGASSLVQVVPAEPEVVAAALEAALVA